MAEEVTKPVEEASEDALTSVCVMKFLETMTERAEHTETYMADPDRKDLLAQLCKDTGVTPNSMLAKHFLSFCDGVETGMAIASAILES